MLDIKDEVVVRGNSVDVENTIKTRGESATPTDRDLTLTNPSSQSIEVIDSDGNISNTHTSPTLISTGYYYQTIDIGATDKLGTWEIKWHITISSKSYVERLEFEVVA